MSDAAKHGRGYWQARLALVLVVLTFATLYASPRFIQYDSCPRTPEEAAADAYPVVWPWTAIEAGLQNPCRTHNYTIAIGILLGGLLLSSSVAIWGIIADAKMGHAGSATRVCPSCGIAADGEAHVADVHVAGKMIDNPGRLSWCSKCGVAF